MTVQRHNPTATVRLLERLGADPRPIDRTDGTHPFATGTRYATCPRCRRFAAITVEGDGIHWHGMCGCWNPRKRYDELDLLQLTKAAR